MVRHRRPHLSQLDVTVSPWVIRNRPYPNITTVNVTECKQISSMLDQHVQPPRQVPNNFLAISVVAAITCVRAHANVPFRLIHFKVNMHQHHQPVVKIERAHRRSIPHTTVVNNNHKNKKSHLSKNFDFFIDFLLSTDHLRRYFLERHSPYFSSFDSKLTTTTLPKVSLLVLLLSSLFPLALATTSSQQNPPSSYTTASRDFSFYADFAFPFGINSSLSNRPQWHAGCCIKTNKSIDRSMCDGNFLPTSANIGKSIYFSNDTSRGTYLFDGANSLIDSRQRPFPINDHSTNLAYLHNQTLFCERYDTFRHLLLTHLGIFTYVVVIVGIILNIFVFLVLMCGSLRRSTSFTLFLALTCFDLLSLASILFAQLFRTVMTYLKASAPFCKMFGIFFLYFRQCSSTTLLLIAIERCVVIKYPFCRHTFDRFRLPFLGIIMILFVMPIPFDFIFFTSGALHCEAFDTPSAHRYQIFRGFFTVFSYAIIPFIGISISNLLIIVELKKSRKRFMTKDEDGTMRRFSSNVIDKRGTTVMLLVASFAFLLLLGPFYVHWCIAYLFYNYPQCQFTRNVYENVQVCMGVVHPYLTVIEKGMRESNHAVNFLLYWATSSRFRLDFKRICRRLIYRIFGTCIIFMCKHICCFCPEHSCLVTLERHVSDNTEQESSYETNRKNLTAYKTAHYYSNFERRRQHQLVTATLLNNNNTTTGNTLSPAPSMNTLTAGTSKTVRILTWNPHDPMMRQLESRRQASRLSKQLSASGAV